MPKKKQERRTYETGSYRRISDTKVRLEVSAGTGLGNKRIRPTKTVIAKNDREAERELKKFIQEIEGKSGENMTINALVDEYTELHVCGLADQTQRWYRETFRRIRGALGHVKLVDIKPAMIEKFYKALANPDQKPFWIERTKDKDGKEKEKPLKNGLEITTVMHHHRALSAALTWGYEKEYLATPVIDRVKAPSTGVTEERALTASERTAYLAALDLAAQRSAKAAGEEGVAASAMLSLFGRIALVMGLRRGELCGLRWEDIEYPVMHVRHSLQYIKDKGIILCDPKTPTSNRRLEMSTELIVLIKAWKKVQAAHALRNGLGGPEYIFERLTGGPLDPRNVSAKFSRIFKDASIEGAKLHSLRHTCATYLLAQGVPPNDVAAFMGHSSTKMTLDVYGHAQENAAANCTAVSSGLLM